MFRNIFYLQWLEEWITLWLFIIAMENGPFIDDFPIKTYIYKGLSMAMLNNQMVSPLKWTELIRFGCSTWTLYFFSGSRGSCGNVSGGSLQLFPKNTGQ